MKKGLILAAGFLAIFMPWQEVKADCDYSEQIKLNNIAASVKATYGIKKVVYDIDGKVVPNMKAEDVQEGDPYFYTSEITVSILNLTEDVYVQITNDKDLDKTIYYKDTINGVFEIEGGNLTDIINYNVKLYSNSTNCQGTELRNEKIVTPKINSLSYYSACSFLPDLSYCQEYISTPFLKTDEEITAIIFSEAEKKQVEIKEEEEKKDSFLEKLKSFYEKNKILIAVTGGIIVIAGATTVVIIIKKRRSRII